MTGTLAGKRIGLLTASASRLGGGVFEAVATHAAMLRELGAEPQVLALHDSHSDDDRATFAPTPVTTFDVLGPRQIGFAPGLLPGLLRARLDCLHLHGIWMYPSAAAARWAAVTGRPYLVSPHGMLDPWITGRGRIKKALARCAYERRSWRRATGFHALTASEAADIARESGRDAIHVVPNAGPAPVVSPPAPRPPHLVYIGRIHAKKNLLALVEAWNRAARPQSASLTIAGWGDAAEIAHLREALARGDGSARFVGPVYGTAKQDLIDSASFVVLPSLSEGLPMAMLEAWARGVPTVMTRHCHLPEAFATGAALECGTDDGSIATVLERAMAIGEAEWGAMSDAALACARGPFSAGAVASAWRHIYAGILGPATGGEDRSA